MEFYYCSPSETFVVLTADQFAGRDDGLLEQQNSKILHSSINSSLLLVSLYKQSTNQEIYFNITSGKKKDFESLKFLNKLTLLDTLLTKNYAIVLNTN